jgi:hypothetical protein
MKQQKVPIILEIIGWYGPLAFIVGFALVSFEVIEARSFAFQLLNLTGAISIIAISLAKKVYQSVVLNTVLGIIALITILQLLWINL